MSRLGSLVCASMFCACLEPNPDWDRPETGTSSDVSGTSAATDATDAEAGTNSAGGTDTTAGDGDTGSDPWGPVDCTRRIRLDIDAASNPEVLEDFPVLVVIDDTILDYAETQDDGSDIRFLDDDNDVKLPHEIEQWDEAGRSFVWVGIPAIEAMSSSDGFWMYFGCTESMPEESAAIWGPHYEGTWHLSGDTLDSGPAAYQGSSSGASASGGVVAGGYNFPGNGSYVDLGDAAELWGASSVSVWGRYDALAEGIGNNLMISAAGPGETADENYQYTLNIESDRRLHMYWEYGSGTDYDDMYSNIAAPVGEDEWHQYVFVRDPGAQSVSFYVDGALLGQTVGFSQPASGGTSATTWLGAAQSDPSAWSFDGELDELRISSDRHSATWVRTDYRSVTNQLLAYGPVETGP